MEDLSHEVPPLAEEEQQVASLNGMMNLLLESLPSLELEDSLVVNKKIKNPNFDLGFTLEGPEPTGFANYRVKKKKTKKFGNVPKYVQKGT